MFSLITQTFQSIWSSYYQVNELSVLILGAPSSGKTTFFFALKNFAQTDQVEHSSSSDDHPITGVNFSKVMVTEENAVLSLTDLGRGLYSFWPEYINEEDIIVYIFDATNLDHLKDIREFLPKLIDKIIEIKPQSPRLIFVSNIHVDEHPNQRSENSTILHFPPHPKVIHELHSILRDRRLTSPIFTCSAKTGEGIESIMKRIIKDGIRKQEGEFEPTPEPIPSFTLKPAAKLQDQLEQIVVLGNENNLKSKKADF